MKVLIDVNHPAHVHFFKNTIKALSELGHDVRVTSRDKDITLEILDELAMAHTVLSIEGKFGLLSLLCELVEKNFKLVRFAKDFRPDVLVAIGGTFVAHTGKILGIPSLVFYDTENAKLQNLITYPFASKVITPSCYKSWVPQQKHIVYDGVHEYAYLAPTYFTPNMADAVENGIDEKRSNYFIRLVSWCANHDVGEQGWNEKELAEVVDFLSQRGNVLISSESTLPSKFDEYIYRGKASSVHHVLSRCHLFIGESATMASEAAILGVPSIYLANTGRGYTDWLEERFQMVINVSLDDFGSIFDVIEHYLSLSEEELCYRHDEMIAALVDVTQFTTQCILGGQAFCKDE